MPRKEALPYDPCTQLESGIVCCPKCGVQSLVTPDEARARPLRFPCWACRREWSVQISPRGIPMRRVSQPLVVKAKKRIQPVWE